MSAEAVVPAETAPPWSSLLGRWFWWDEAPAPNTRAAFHGQFTADLGMGYYLVRFDAHERLAPGVQETVHIERIAGERWSVFDSADELRIAMNGGAAG